MHALPISFEVLNRLHPERQSLEAFIAQVFLKSYGAKVNHFAHTLLGWKDKAGQWVAALGYTPAEDNTLFVENYGGKPMEIQVSERLGSALNRQTLVEVGNLAATSAGAARMLIANAVIHLHRQDFSWVVFTATRALLNSFDRLEVKAFELGAADPVRLPDGGQSWGTYYDSRPCIMSGSITLAYLGLMAKQNIQPVQMQGLGSVCY